MFIRAISNHTARVVATVIMACVAVIGLLGTAGAAAAPQPGGGDDVAPPGTQILTISQNNVAYEADGKVFFTLTRTQTSEPLAVSVNLVNYSTEDEDFTGALPLTWNFPAGVAERTTSVGIADNDGVEGRETFAIYVSTDTTDYIINDSIAEAKILDGDGPQLAIEDAEAVEGDAGSGGSMPVQIKASYPPLEDITFSLQTSEFGFEAEPGVDFEPFDMFVTLPAGETSTAVSVQLIGDDEVEDDELFPIYAGNPSAGVFPVGDGSAELRILDDDEAGEGGQPSDGGGGGMPSGQASENVDADLDAEPAPGSTSATMGVNATDDDGSFDASSSDGGRSGRTTVLSLLGLGLILVAIGIVARLLWRELRRDPMTAGEHRTDTLAG